MTFTMIQEVEATSCAIMGLVSDLSSKLYIHSLLNNMLLNYMVHLQHQDTQSKEKQRHGKLSESLKQKTAHEHRKSHRELTLDGMEQLKIKLRLRKRKNSCIQ